MKKISVFIFVMVCCSRIFAYQSPIVCPATLTCNYAAGTCNLPPGQWVVYGNSASQPFTTVNLTQILGSTYYTTPLKQHTSLNCFYQYGPGFNQMQITIPVRKFTGVNWIFSGFGNDKATCQSITDPSTCAAE